MSAPLPGTAARVDLVGRVFALGPKAAADEVVTEQDVQEPAKLARLLCRILKDVAALRRRWAPRSVDFEDVVVGSTPTTHSFEHNFGGRVRWWVVGWTSLTSTAPILLESGTAITSKTLVLLSYAAGTMTLRVEEAG